MNNTNKTVDEAVDVALYRTTYRAVSNAVSNAVRGAVYEAVVRAVGGTVGRVVDWAVSTVAVGEPDHPALQDFLRPVGRGSVTNYETNNAVYWKVDGAVTRSVYWKVGRAEDNSVDWAVYRAMGRTMASEVDEDLLHPALQDYLKEAGVA